MYRTRDVCFEGGAISIMKTKEGKCITQKESYDLNEGSCEFEEVLTIRMK